MKNIVFALFMLLVGSGCSDSEVIFPDNFVYDADVYSVTCLEHDARVKVFPSEQAAREFFEVLSDNYETASVNNPSNFYWFMAYDDEGEIQYFVTSSYYDFDPQLIIGEDSFFQEFRDVIHELILSNGPVKSIALCIR